MGEGEHPRNTTRTDSTFTVQGQTALLADEFARDTLYSAYAKPPIAACGAEYGTRPAEIDL